jgi:hypothetical protein
MKIRESEKTVLWEGGWGASEAEARAGAAPGGRPGVGVARQLGGGAGGSGQGLGARGLGAAEGGREGGGD